MKQKRNVLSNAEKKDVTNQITELENKIEGLRLLEDPCMMDYVNEAIKKMKEKEFKFKETKVLNIHTNAITKMTVKKNGKLVEKWQTICGDKRPRHASYDALIEHLFTYYYGEMSDSRYIFAHVFDDALAEKIATEDPKEKTIRDLRSSYKAFISEDFSQKDVRKIKATEVKIYIQQVTQELNLTKKRLYKFKGVLNLVFDFATDPERLYITVNPVPHNNRAYVKNCTQASHNPEDKAFQPAEIKRVQDHLWHRVSSRTYDVNGYAILFASETGVREGEIPSLKWEDILPDKIQIHSQQNDEMRDGEKCYYYNPCTKDEKGVSRGGRYLPLNQRIREILDDLKEKQEKLGIKSEWVFARLDGSWMTTLQYYEALYKVSHKLGLQLSNNHAFRMALNSYVFVPMGLPATERAKLLGHSVETNLKYYTFARSDEHLDEICRQWDDFYASQQEKEGGTFGYPNIVAFEGNKKSLRSAKIKAF